MMVSKGVMSTFNFSLLRKLRLHEMSHKGELIILRISGPNMVFKNSVEGTSKVAFLNKYDNHQNVRFFVLFDYYYFFK